MTKLTKYQWLGVGFLVTVLAVAGFIGVASETRKQQPLGEKPALTTQPSSSKRAEEKPVLSYPGRDGRDALSLLINVATVEQDKNGMVVAINEKKADASKKEYWAFYVNGKLAPVGPKQYISKDTDKIEWRIEKY